MEFDMDYTELEEHLKMYEERFNEMYVTTVYLTPSEVIEDIKERLKTGKKVEVEELFNDGIPIMY